MKLKFCPLKFLKVNIYFNYMTFYFLKISGPILNTPEIVLGIRIFGSDRFDLFCFRVLRIGMFRNQTILVRLDSDNIGFRSEFYFL